MEKIETVPLIRWISDRYLSWVDIVGPNKYLQALIVTVIFVLLAKLADVIICGVLAKAAARTSTKVDDYVIKRLHRPLNSTVVIIGLGVATLLLELPPAGRYVVIGILRTIVIFVWLRFAIQVCGDILAYVSKKRDRIELVQASTLPLFNNLSNIALVALAIYAFMLAWEINVTAWLASAGIVGLALSFAAKDTLANLFAGMAILADAPYKPGDFIILETGERGEVTDIGMRSTRIMTRDDVEITIPNGVMGNSKIINQSGGPHTKHRIRIKVSCAYGSDIDHVRQLLMNAAEEEPGVCESPEPRVRFRSFGDSGLAFELLCWVRLPVMRGQIEDKLNCDIYKRFAQEGIEIPYPKQDVYVRHVPSSTQAQD